MPLNRGPDEPPVPRRRRRAVGPPGAAPHEDSGLRLLADPGESVPDDVAAREEELRRDVPPHHGG